MKNSPDEIEMTEKAVQRYSQDHTVHEYAFGILSSDTKGLATVVSITAPFTSSDSSSEEDLMNSVGFQSWSMSRYQSLYHSSSFHESEEFEEDNNNNKTTTTTPATLSLTETSGPSLKTSRSSGSLGMGSSPTRSFRRWSTNSQPHPVQQIRFVSVDPEISFSCPEHSESWLTAIAHIPDKIRQHIADRHRFNVNTAPREQLKHLYCY